MVSVTLLQDHVIDSTPTSSDLDAENLEGGTAEHYLVFKAFKGSVPENDETIKVIKSGVENQNLVRFVGGMFLRDAVHESVKSEKAVRVVKDY